MESEISIVSSEVSLSTVQQLPKGAPQKIAVEEEQFNKVRSGGPPLMGQLQNFVMISVLGTVQFTS